MIRYTPAAQLTLEGFEHPFDQALDPDNRWVILAKLIPWDKLAGVYAKNLKNDSGRLSVDVRLVIGALIVKHRLKLSDRDTVDEIAENVYIQFFCGLKSFQAKKPFDPSLFVDIRKRMGSEEFDAFNDFIIAETEKIKPRKKRIRQDNEPNDANGPIDTGTGGRSTGEPVNKGTLKIDATVADQQILYPTDLGLLNRCREETERLIDQLYKLKRDQLKIKPRTYRRIARKRYLAIAKKKRKTKREIRKAIGQQIRYLRRNIRTIHRLLDMFETEGFPFKERDQRIFWSLQLIYEQQKYMYDHKTHKVPDRLVNIYQPYVRPIVRGKDKAEVEFGAKISISEYEGMSKVDQISWDAYNESAHLVMQVEAYRNTFNCWPEVLLADRIYLNRENRKWLKQRNIKIVGKPLGRPPKQPMTNYQKRKQKKLRNKRNHVEGKIGQGKNGYGLNKIRARRSDTSQSWIQAIYFVMNLVNLSQTYQKQILTTILTAIALAGAFFLSLIKPMSKAIKQLNRKFKKLSYLIEFPGPAELAL